MTGPLWFDADTGTCDKVNALHNKSIAARAVLPNGWVIEGVGEIWTRVNGARTKAAVTVVFEYATEPYVITQTRIHLSKEQYEAIRNATKPGTDREYPGDLKPPLIQKN